MKTIGQWTQKWAEKSSITCEYFQQIDSTNKKAKEMPIAGADLHLLVTDTQTSGRGRGKNTWSSPEPGSALLSSWMLNLSSAPQPITAALIWLGSLSKRLEKLVPSELVFKSPKRSLFRRKENCRNPPGKYQ
jgi:biotin-(acetyl-CoA carboxylase) ligase